MLARPVRVRKEVSEAALNVEFASLLREQGLSVLGEARIQSPRGLRKPDVLIQLNGIRIILEGRFEEHKLEEDCRRRLEEGLAELSVAVVYPDETISWEDWQAEGPKAYLRQAVFRVRIFRLSGENTGIHQTPWQNLRLDELLQHLETAYRALVSENLVERAVARLSEGIARAADALLRRPQPEARAGQIATILQIPHSRRGTPAQRTEALTKMAALSLINATLFHEVLSSQHPEVPTPLKLESPLRDSLASVWRFILDHIDYNPIFEVAREILLLFPASPQLEEALKAVLRTASFLAASKALLRHDLMGRVYHTLLMQDIAKYYATYYTSVPAATLLANLGLDLENPSWQVAWENTENMASFKVCDLACGSGTLLSAVYRAILYRHIQASFSEGQPPAPDEVHKVLMDEVLWAFDVLTYAAHLAATGLALHNPSATFQHGNIYVMPLGIQRGEKHLGSLDFFKGPLGTPIQLGAAPVTRRVAPSEIAAETIELPLFNLIIMNPPFTRNVGQNLLFGDLPQRERKALCKERNAILKQRRLSGIGQAGLGADFAILADRYLQQGGRLCLVIPRSLLSGVSWRKVREHLSEHYTVEVIIASHEAPRSWNFSENTDLSEILIVARKLERNEARPPAIVVNLWRRPRNEWEALALAGYLIDARPALLSGPYNILESSSASTLPLRLGLGLWGVVGEAYTVSQELLQRTRETWGQLCPFAQGELNRPAYWYLSQHRLYIPGAGLAPQMLPLSPLGVEKLGPDTRQVHNVFSPTEAHTVYRALWGVQSESMTSFRISPNMFLQPRAGQSQRATNLWNQAARLMVVDRLWLKTYRLVAAYLDRRALSNVWWPVRLEGGQTRDGENFTGEEAQKVQTLWLNTTPGLLGLLALRQDTRGAGYGSRKQPWD